MRLVSFKTQARTIDHLGREQIADCPTAITELWKNAYDAYAKNVELHIFDGDEPVAAIFDDGHGMSYEEFINRWLVVGTESKYANDATPVADRNGLEPRSRQGQKGIGRLSSANLGPLLLIVSKRIESDFVVALIDWRVFENPFLILSDIQIPVVEIKDKSNILDHLPSLLEGLTQNVWGGVDDPERNARIEAAWKAYDQISIGDSPLNHKAKSPSEEIARTMIDACFDERHFRQWELWGGDSRSGTAMLVSGINYDLSVYVNDEEVDTTAEHSKNRFFETLSSFVDPFTDPAKPEVNSHEPNFDYSVWVHRGRATRLILGFEKQFTLKQTEEMEHVLDGQIDEQGVFRGQVKAFGDWVYSGNDYVIEPPKNLRIHTRRDWKVGPIDLYLATFEQLRSNTTLSEESFKRANDLAGKYSGFLVFRNSLRLMPYGRVDNDFFEIEMRRSKMAGREFWNARRMLGRLALSRGNNPNLRDKAGREGLIDNVAAKTFKKLVENVLKTAARDHFGSNADMRMEKLPEIQAKYKEGKINAARNKLRKKNRTQFKANLRVFNNTLPSFSEDLTRFEKALEISSLDALSQAQEDLDHFRNKLAGYRLPGAPTKLGSLEDEYTEYRRNIAVCTQLTKEMALKIDDAILSLSPSNPEEIVEKQLKRSAGQLQSRIRKWKVEIEKLQSFESLRIDELVSARNKEFQNRASVFIDLVKNANLELSEALNRLDALRVEFDGENEEIFGSYTRALENLTESIDLELLALDSTEENDKLRGELDRLNGLAQLGIAVEVLGHELQSYDDMIGRGIRRLPKNIQDSSAVSDIRMGYDGLTNQLRFLSPLKLSGEKIQKWISGEEIKVYLQDFYGEMLERKGIDLVASNSFLKFRVFEQPSRLLPVFINLVNNSVYWVGFNPKKKKVGLDIVGNEVVVSDNGPGIDELDIDRLFSLFFTKKTAGGRGVGLYLAKANLAAGGHKIRYEGVPEKGTMSGANFVISLKGAEYDS